MLRRTRVYVAELHNQMELETVVFAPFFRSAELSIVTTDTQLPTDGIQSVSAYNLFRDDDIRREFPRLVFFHTLATN